MRALLVDNYTSVEFLSVRDVPRPTVEEGQARVRVKAAGIGFVEALKIAGRYQTKDPLPFVPGTEFAGVVEKVGHCDVAENRRTRLRYRSTRRFGRRDLRSR